MKKTVRNLAFGVAATCMLAACSEGADSESQYECFKNTNPDGTITFTASAIDGTASATMILTPEGEPVSLQITEQYGSGSRGVVEYGVGQCAHRLKPVKSLVP